MNLPKRMFAFGGALAIGVAGWAQAVQAEETSDMATLEAKLASMQSRIAELEASQAPAWTADQRAAEVRALVNDVLADAETRASMLENGMYAGHNGKFFLASEDGRFVLNVGGQTQINYISNFRDNNPDDNQGGFVIRRAKLSFDGHVGDPKITYKIVLAADRNSGVVFAEDVVVGYQVSDTVEVEGGRQKLPFSRQELTSSKNLTAIDRTPVHETFTLNRSEGIWVNADVSDMIKVAVAVSDGANAAPADWNADASELAVTGRADVKLAGEWSQMQDYQAWSGEDTGVFFGAAFHQEWGEDGVTGPDADFFTWTGDVSVEMMGMGLSAAGYGLHVDFDNDTNVDLYGYEVQAQFMVIADKLEPYVQYMFLTGDRAVTGDKHIVVGGVNYFLNKHKAKFTADVVWAADPLDDGAINRSDGLGLRNDAFNEDNQVALRAGFQLLF